MRNNSNLSPIVFFVYNRPKHTREAISALKRDRLAKNSDLFIFSDGPKSESDREMVKEVRSYISQVRGFNSIEIIERDENLGLAKSVIKGVSSVLEKFEKVIVLEDDIVVSPAFLSFMNKMLEAYKSSERVFSITGYSYPENCCLYQVITGTKSISPRAGSWSWATWRGRWAKADWEVSDYGEFKNDKKAQEEFNRGGEDLSRMLINQMKGEIDSWAIRWCYALYNNNGLCVYPVKSYANSIGLDGSGTHSGSSDKYWNINLNSKIEDFSLPKDVKENKKVVARFHHVFRVGLKGRIKNFIVVAVKWLEDLFLD